MAEGKKLRALVFALPHQGHLTPTINLALKLASKGLSVTFVNFRFIHVMMSKARNKSAADFDLFYEARKSGLDISYTTMDDGLPDQFDRHGRIWEFYDYMLEEFQPLLDEFVGEIIRSDPESTYFIVADTILLWQAVAAKKYNLVHVSFWTQPALVFSLFYHSQLLGEKGHYPLKDNVEEEIDYIPGVQTVNTKDFMPMLKESTITTTLFRFSSSAFHHVKTADIILHNTVEESESSTLLALNNYQSTYAIGPVNFYEGLTNKSLWRESSCTSWLKSKPPCSVLYVSFGSVVPPDQQVIAEIAHGLILSGVNFIWVTREGVEGTDLHVFPIGFEDEFKDRGLIVPWCNQTAVLSDPAVGGFLTHCGWNSVVESIWFGVPMLCYPVDFDQPLNRKLVVDDWKVGINLCDGKGICRNEVAEKVRCVVTGKMSRENNQHIVNARNMLRNALQPDGSSERNFNQFITDLKKKLGSKCEEQQASII